MWALGNATTSTGGTWQPLNVIKTKCCEGNLLHFWYFVKRIQFLLEKRQISELQKFNCSFDCRQTTELHLRMKTWWRKFSAFLIFCQKNPVFASSKNRILLTKYQKCSNSIVHSITDMQKNPSIKSKRCEVKNRTLWQNKRRNSIVHSNVDRK